MSIDFVRWRRSSVLAGIVVKLRNSIASDEARSNCRFSYLIVVVALSLMGSFLVSAFLCILAVAVLSYFFAAPITVVYNTGRRPTETCSHGLSSGTANHGGLRWMGG